MSRVTTSNYTADVDTIYKYATSDNDQYDRELDISFLARALERHDHTAGRGLPVSRIASGIVDETALGAGSVTTAKLADLGVTSAKIAADAVTATQIAPSAVGASEIVDGGVGTAELADGSVTTIKHANVSVTTAKLADLNVTTAKIADLNVTAGKLAAGVAVSNLGYTPVNKAGDNAIGNLTLATTKILQFLGENGVKIDLANGAYSFGVATNVLEIQSDRDVGFRDNSASAGVYAFLMNCLTGQFTIPVATGTAPLVIASTTEVANLNASRVAGKVPTATPGAGVLPLADGSGKLDAFVTAAAASWRTGDVRFWVGTAANLAAELATGFLECDGSNVSRTTYATLFGKIGTGWGVGDGSTTFGLPPFGDRSPMGKSGTKASGATGGSATVNSEHAHANNGTTSGSASGTDGYGGGGGSLNPAGHTHPYSNTTANGGSTTLATQSPYAVGYFLIKT